MDNMSPTPEKWQQAIDRLFSDEEELKVKLNQMRSADPKGQLVFLHWLLDNNWRVHDALCKNTVTGEEKGMKELREVFEKENK